MTGTTEIETCDSQEPASAVAETANGVDITGDSVSVTITSCVVVLVLPYISAVSYTHLTLPTSDLV